MSYRPYGALKASGLEVKYQNGSGATLPKATPVRKMSSGLINTIDVSIESDIMGIIGVTYADIPDTQIGSVITVGRIENVSIAFAFGDPVYLSKTGGLTNTKPDVGIAGFVVGDFVVRLATVARNETNPLQKDLVLEITLVGQL